MISADVIVIGAGISGLVAADEILQHDQSLEVLVLESGDRIGGRLETAKFEVGKASVYLDLGGHAIEEDQSNVLQLLDQLGLRTYGLNREYGKDRLEGYGYFARLEWQFAVAKLDRLSKDVEPRNPYKNKRLAHQLDGITVKSYMERLCYSSLGPRCVENKTRALFGQDTSSISMLFLLTYASSVGGFARMFYGQQQQKRGLLAVEGGARLMCERLCQRLGGDKRVMLNQPVVSVTKGDDGKILVTTASGHQTFQCSRVICAIPPVHSSRIDFHPPLRGALVRMLANMGPGEATKVVLVHKEGQAGTRPNKTIVIDTGYERHGCSVRTGYLTTRPGLEHYPEESLRLSLTETLGVEEETSGGSLVHFEIKHWGRMQPFSEGSGGPISCTPRPGTMIHYYLLRQADGGISFAGAETATKWIGHISGAIQSGRRAAIQILDELRPQALSAIDYAFLKDAYVSGDEKLYLLCQDDDAARSSNSTIKTPFTIYRWTFFLPLLGLAFGYSAYAMRNRYCGLLVPMHP